MNDTAYTPRHARVSLHEAADSWADAWTCLDAVRDNPTTPDRVFVAATELAFTLIEGPVATFVLSQGRAA